MLDISEVLLVLYDVTKLLYYSLEGTHRQDCYHFDIHFSNTEFPIGNKPGTNFDSIKKLIRVIYIKGIN